MDIANLLSSFCTKCAQPDYGSLPFAIGASVRQRRRPCMPRTGTCGRCHNRHSMLCWYLISLWFLDPIWQQRHECQVTLHTVGVFILRWYGVFLLRWYQHKNDCYRR